MASTPVLRDIALRFLRASVDGGAHAGDMLGPNRFKGPVRLPGLMADIPAALDYAAGQGWLERLPDSQYRLTSVGFAAAQISN